MQEPNEEKVEEPGDIQDTGQEDHAAAGDEAHLTCLVALFTASLIFQAHKCDLTAFALGATRMDPPGTLTSCWRRNSATSCWNCELRGTEFRVRDA